MAAASINQKERPRVVLLGVPVGHGAGEAGACRGPAALRSIGIARALEQCGCEIVDHGDLRPPRALAEKDDPSLRKLARNAPIVGAYTQLLADAAYRLMKGKATPMFLGGDHSLAMGTVAGVARHWAEAKRDLFLLWLDAHADYNTPSISPTGNMHGMALAMLTGERGFEPLFGDPPCKAVVPENVYVLGLRSVDPDEDRLLRRSGVHVIGMRRLNAVGVRLAMQPMLDEVSRRDGVLHVSVDVDVLDPGIAPGVGTPAPGGATLEQARLIMRTLRDCGRVASLDVAELNPSLDIDGRSARAVVELVTNLFGESSASRSSRLGDRHGQDAA
ncbi:MAG: arginase [Methylocystis sp.]|nr:arginase [Methylocystis sp.]